MGLLKLRIRHGGCVCILGPMFSGKTAANKAHEAKKNGVFVKYGGDQRYDAKLITSHDRIQGTCFKTFSSYSLKELRETLLQFQCIFIDEGQFFTDLPQIVKELVDDGKEVFISALELDVNRNYWEAVSGLQATVPETRVKKLKADCHMCGGKQCAEINYRTSSHTARVYVGGAEAYIAVCDVCDAIRQRADT